MSMPTRRISFLELFNGQYQYVVPRWQRRYCWGQSDIKRLVDDLLTVAAAKGPEALHYGGTLLTFSDSSTAGLVTVYRVVDGQQRLTTVSILLACIADVLGKDGQCGDWTAKIIKNDRLTNPGKSPDRFRKLRLQDGDEEEYKLGLEGKPAGAGAVTQAWKIMKRLVRKENIGQLLTGLERLQVYSIALQPHDDPQQIFESLNATGRPLTESEKIKNWLLMGLPDTKQQELHDGSWRQIEELLNAKHSTDRIDIFLRDFLRWKTGELRGINHVYEDLRRWAVQNNKAKDRPALCVDLAEVAVHYGVLTGTSGCHGNKDVERELCHLRDMGLDTHRPLTLRLLHEAASNGDAGWTDLKLAKVFAGIGTWVTRVWLSDRPMTGMNKAFAELAHGRSSADDEDPVEFWKAQIRSRRNSRVEVPDDEAVKEGIYTRKAYGGSATRVTKAVLCAMMEEEQHRECPVRDALTVEHIMPQKLTDEWRSALGDDAEQIHGQYRDRLANLTLTGVNQMLGAKPFEEKCDIMKNTGIQMNKRIVDEEAWNEASLKRRAENIADRVLDLWPWSDTDVLTDGPQSETWEMRWCIERGDWHEENAAAQMVLNIAGALISRDLKNADRLLDHEASTKLRLATQYPPGSKAGSRTMQAVPGHDSYVMYPYGNRKASVAKCKKMGERCGLKVEIEFRDTPDVYTVFWTFFKAETGGLPGQNDDWRWNNCWTKWINDKRDRICIRLTHERTELYLRTDEDKNTLGRAERMLQYSRNIRNVMSDQKFAGNEVTLSKKGKSITVWRTWDRDDEDGWVEAAIWIKDQAGRLQDIAETFVSIPEQAV